MEKILYNNVGEYWKMWYINKIDKKKKRKTHEKNNAIPNKYSILSFAI